MAFSSGNLEMGCGVHLLDRRDGAIHVGSVYDFLTKLAYGYSVHGLEVERIAVDRLFSGLVHVLDGLGESFAHHCLWEIFRKQGAVDARAWAATRFGLVE